MPGILKENRKCSDKELDTLGTQGCFAGGLMEYKLSSFQFHDLLTREEKHMAIMRINALRSACPSDANFSGDFTVDGKDSYQGTLRVLFSKGEFGATVDANNMEDLMDKLSQKIKKQIERWRETRFEQEDTFVDFKEKAK